MSKNYLLEAGAISETKVSLTKWFSIHLRIKWLWAQTPLLSLKLQIWCLLRTKISLTFRKTTECRFLLKLLRDMIITCSKMQRTDKYSQHSWIILFFKLTSLDKWVSVRLRTKWLWVRIQLLPLNISKNLILNNELD